MCRKIIYVDHRLFTLFTCRSTDAKGQMGAQWPYLAKHNVGLLI